MPDLSAHLEGRHFLDIADLSATALRALLDDAHARKAARLAQGEKQGKKKSKKQSKGAPDADAPLQGMLLAMIFDKPSTRTRLSFDVAMRQLGGDVLILNRGDAQFGRGESFADTAQVVSRFADVMMMRTGAHDNLTTLAHHASVPVINGLTDFSHPCQIIADLMTFEEHKGKLAGQRIAWIGDGNNVAVSFAHAAPLLGFELALACPAGYTLSASALGSHVVQCDTAQAAAAGAAALVTDCWLSMGDDESTKAARQKAFAPYQITPALMAEGDDAIFMHCLPAYRGQEVASAVIDGARSVVFDEAENRCHAQKAILTYCLKE